MSHRAGDNEKENVELLNIPSNGWFYSSIDHSDNHVKSSKYNWYNFLFLNLFHQMTTLANLYFFIIGVFQMIPRSSTSGGLPTIYVPLTTILTVNAVRAAFEDLSAYKNDKQRNNTLYWILAPFSTTHERSDGDEEYNKLLLSKPKKTSLLEHSDLDNLEATSQAVLLDHPGIIYHRYQSQQRSIPKHIKNRSGFVTTGLKNPTKSVRLPGLELEKHVAKAAYEACKPQGGGLLSFLGLSSAPTENPNINSSLISSSSNHNLSHSNMSASISSLRSIQRGAYTQLQEEYDTIPEAHSTQLKHAHTYIDEDGVVNQQQSTVETKEPHFYLDEPDEFIISRATQARRDFVRENGDFKLCTAGELRVGQICKIYKNQLLPADMILLGTSDQRNSCFVDKSNLNGETTLEILYAPFQLRKFFNNVPPANPNSSTIHSNISSGTSTSSQSSNNQSDSINPSLYDLDFRLHYSPPNGDFDDFRCELSAYSHVNPTKKPITFVVTPKQLLLRETVIRNTDYVIGLIVYTGENTKISQSLSAEKGSKTNIKSSRIMELVNHLVFILFFVQFGISLIVGAYYGYWVYMHGAGQHWYLMFDNGTIGDTIISAVYSAFSWCILCSTLVPISLLVSLETCKLIMSWFIEWDAGMYNTNLGRGAKCNTSTIHENLALCSMLFTDKTGTLTQNMMEFRYLSVAIHTPFEYHQMTASDPKIQPLSATQAFESFGNYTTDISRKVKEKMNKNKKSNHITNINKATLRYLPHEHPFSYSTLPKRWTSSLYEQNLVHPTNAPYYADKTWFIADLAKNAFKYYNPFYFASVSAGSHDSDNGEFVVKSKPPTYSLISYLWNTAQGHGYAGWYNGLRTHYIINQNYAQINKLKIKLSNKTKKLLMLKKQEEHEQAVRQNDYIQRRKSQIALHRTNTPDAYAMKDLGSSGESSLHKFPGNSSFVGQDINELSLFANHSAYEVDDEFGINEKSSISDDVHYERSLISTFNIANTVLKQISTHQQLAQNKPQQLLSSFSSPNNTSSPLTSPDGSNLQTDSKPLSAYELACLNPRLSWEREYYLSLQHLIGSFGPQNREAILTTLWSKNWAKVENCPSYNAHYQISTNKNPPTKFHPIGPIGKDGAQTAGYVYVAPRHVRESLFRFMRHMALSSTVKAYRKPDGRLDWQFESSEELSMVKFAFSCGFIRDIHPSGEGTILFIREYFSPDFSSPSIDKQLSQLQAVQRSNTSSSNDILSQQTAIFKQFNNKVHVEVYSNIATFGFTSKRARVSLILQRNTAKHGFAPYSLMNNCEEFEKDANGFSLPLFDINKVLEGYQTHHKYSTYLYEYDYMFRNVDEDKTKGNHHDDIDESFGVGTSATTSKSPPDTDESISIHPLDINAMSDKVSEYSLYQDFYTLKTNNIRYNKQIKPYIQVLCKGQDTTTLPLLTDILNNYKNAVANTDPLHFGMFNPQFTNSIIPYSNSYHTIKQQLHQLENAGLRCLVCAYAELSNTWWAQFDQTYTFVNELDPEALLPINSFKDLNAYITQIGTAGNAADIVLQTTTSKKNITSSPNINPSTSIKSIKHDFFEFIEQQSCLTLLGNFAMEDKIQPLVPETIRDFRRAGIRCFMITGDKLDVAKNIGLAVDLIDGDMVNHIHHGSTKPSDRTPSISQGITHSSSLISLITDDSSVRSHEEEEHDVKINYTLIDPEAAIQNTESTLLPSQSSVGIPRAQSSFNQKDKTHIELPIAIRNYHSERLIEVTGSWRTLYKQRKRDALNQIFTALVEDEDEASLLPLGYLQQCLLYLGLDLTLQQIGLLFVVNVDNTGPMGDEVDTYVNRSNQFTPISRQHFINAFALLGDSITEYDSIDCDVAHGLSMYYAVLQRATTQRTNSHTTNHKIDDLMLIPQDTSVSNQFVGDDAPGISLLVNRTAFNVIFQQETTSTNLSKSTDTSDGERLSILAQKFIILSIFSKSVICSQALPSHKAKIVTSIQRLFPTALCAAVGDGSNDVNMLLKANVSFGLAGLEGSSAANNADYVINANSFYHLHSLFFKHGTLSYLRIEKIILMMFYKGSMLAFTHLLYGLHSSFSGQQLYLDILYQLYNVIYTCWCVLLMVLSTPLPTPVLENSPVVYREVKSNSFNLQLFFKWMFKAFIHSLFIFYIPSCMMLIDNNDLFGGSTVISTIIDKKADLDELLVQQGKTNSYLYNSNIILCAIAIIPNLLSFLLMESVNLPFIIIVGMSAMTIFVSIGIVSLTSVAVAGDLYRAAYDIFTNVQFWAILLITIACPLILEYCEMLYTTHFDTTGRFFWSKGISIVQLLKERIYLREYAYNKLLSKEKKIKTDLLKIQENEKELIKQQLKFGHAITNCDNQSVDINVDHQIRTTADTLVQFEHDNHNDKKSNANFVETSIYSQYTILTTPENIIQTPYDIQLKGVDPDPDALISAHHFGEAGGYGVRATVADELYQQNSAIDSYNLLTVEAEGLLREIKLGEIIQPSFLPQALVPGGRRSSLLSHTSLTTPGYNVAAQSQQLNGILTRVQALSVFRVLLLACVGSNSSTFHSASKQNYQNERFVGLNKK